MEMLEEWERIILAYCALAMVSIGLILPTFFRLVKWRFNRIGSKNEFEIKTIKKNFWNEKEESWKVRDIQQVKRSDSGTKGIVFDFLDSNGNTSLQLTYPPSYSDPSSDLEALNVYLGDTTHATYERIFTKTHSDLKNTLRWVCFGGAALQSYMALSGNDPSKAVHSTAERAIQIVDVVIIIYGIYILVRKAMMRQDNKRNQSTR